MTTFPPLQTQRQRISLGDQVYEAIRDRIVTLTLPPGTMIYENELAEMLQVSRTPIREAIRSLVNEQLLEVLPQRGTRIAPISERKVHDTRFVREHLELGAFRLAARLWDAERHRSVKAKLEELLQRQEAAAVAGDIAQFLNVDEAFHHAILQVAGNETLLQVVGHMRAHLNRFRYLALQELQQLERITAEHRLLAEAIELGDEALAADRLGAHLGKLAQDLTVVRRKYPDYFTD
ncbi:GntR family transcriptional regulator [Paenibacillus chartarius]|uniref:GntR family transcriptional regulator n=1 Tax=Paenibacillus chartarius TaxID=747481 RepID=A0ABV6DU49_9BACL